MTMTKTDYERVALVVGSHRFNHDTERLRLTQEFITVFSANNSHFSAEKFERGCGVLRCHIGECRFTTCDMQESKAHFLNAHLNENGS